MRKPESIELSGAREFVDFAGDDFLGRIEFALKCVSPKAWVLLLSMEGLTKW